MRSAAGRSPLYEQLWRRLADEPFVDQLVDEYRWDTPLRLTAALHYLVLGGEARWEAVDEALRGRAGFIRRFVAEQGVQTNEVQRSWMLLPCFLEAAGRAGAEALDVIELGPSAGLNLVWDRYRYRYAEGEWGRPDAGVELRGEERRSVPARLLARSPQVRRRIGIDVAPIDAASDEGARLLKAFVWADQTWRLDLLERAIAELRREPPELVCADAAEALPALLAGRDRDVLTLVFQTAVLAYFPAPARRRVLDAIDDAGREGNLAYVASGQPGRDVHTYWALRVRVWPGPASVVAHADFHGKWLEWLG